MTESDTTAPPPRSPTPTAVLGGGCFWCLEAVFQRMDGVLDVTSGYAGGHDPSPTYRTVCSGTTGHAEVVRVTFDPDVISYRRLLDIFFTIHDPTTPDRQGTDVGPQYRSIVLYDGPEQRREAEDTLAKLAQSDRWPDPPVTELAPLERFHPAEPDHRNYYLNHSMQPYCRIVIEPKLAEAQRTFTTLFRDPPSTTDSEAR